MSAKRAPAAPPDLPGYTWVQPLGSGGFADVHLYEQEKPRRMVAIKVLIPELLSDESLQAFNVEADIMASLADQPSIITIYGTDVSADGRPYLVMEYCDRGTLEDRFRKQPLSVAEALRIGIQVAGAVETAHRAGILHRDIKPANVLVTKYNRPALTDFGISAASGPGETSEVTAMSIIWSPPESFDSPAWSNAQSDVWSLGATVYALLAGRSPFWVPGGQNDGASLLSRITSAPLQPIRRADVPASLEAVLATAMAKNNAARYPSALALAREFQSVQNELQHSVTPVDLLDDSLPPDAQIDEDDGKTRIRSVVSIDPHAAPPTAPRGAQGPSPTFAAAAAAAAAAEATLDGRTVPRGALHPEDPVGVGDASTIPASRSGAGGAVASSLAAPAVEDTVHRPQPSVALRAEHVPAERRSRRGLIAGVVGGVLLVAAVVVGVIVLGEAPLDSGTARPGDDPTSAPVDVVPEGIVPAVTDLVAEVGASDVTFRWTNPEPAEGDAYLWGVVDATGETALERTSDAVVSVQPAAAGQTCIEVILVRDNGRSSEESTVCTP